MAEQERTGKFEISVVGVAFEGRQGILAALYEDQESGPVLTGQVRREPDNRFDPNAIAVDVGGRQVGYVPKALADKLSVHMDAGEEIRVTGVRIIRGEKKGSVTFGVRIDVELQAEKEAV